MREVYLLSHPTNLGFDCVNMRFGLAGVFLSADVMFLGMCLVHW